MIIESKEPYVIVHSNASFSRLSGTPSDLLVGSSLLKFAIKLDKNPTIDLLLPEASDLKEKDTNEAQVLAGGHDKVMKCNVVIFQVPCSSKDQDRCNKFSHYVLDFEKVGSNGATVTHGINDKSAVANNSESDVERSTMTESKDTKETEETETKPSTDAKIKEEQNVTETEAKPTFVMG